MKHLSIDIETYSSENLAKCGVYRYCQSPDFEVLLFGYSVDGGPVKVVDLANGETIPDEIICAIVDDKVIKWAFNAQFERICLSRYLGGNVGVYMNPASWRCTMVWAATLGLPLSLEGVGAVLGLEKQKLKEGKDLIRYFCTPAKAKDGSTFRHYPSDAPEKWETFKAYNLRDVETEMAIQDKLSKFPVAESEWRNYHLDQQINDRGIMLDMTMVHQAIACDDQFKRTHMEQARSVTGLENPNSPAQLKEWLAERGVEAESLSKAAVLQMLEEADGEVELALSLRQELAKSSVKKYTAMEAVVGTDSRARGLIQFYGANRTGRYAGRLIQVQNLPQNHLPDLDTVRTLIRNGQFDTVELLYDRQDFEEITLETALALAYGGTGATTAADARTNLGIACTLLYSGTLTTGSTTFNYGSYKAYVIIGQPNSTSARVSLFIPKAQLTTTATAYQLADETNYYTFNLSYSGSTVTLAYKGRSGSGQILRVFGVN